MNKYNFYMQKKLPDGGTDVIRNLESDFEGMKYLKCKGINTYGKPKNIYTETYAETSSLRVHLPDKITRENTDIEFEFLFTGNNAQKTYDEFVEYITNAKVLYWDDYRNKQVEMVNMEAVEPSEEKYYGETFLKATVKFKNLNGQATLKQLKYEK